MWLHTKVPAVFETIAGNPASRNAATAALTGSPVKYAAGPVATIGRSIGCCPSLSGRRASSTLIATRSSDNSARPPANPTHSTMSGCVAAIASSSVAIARPNTVGTMRVSIVRSSNRDGSRSTASPDGLIASAPNGSNPVTSAFIVTIPARMPETYHKCLFNRMHQRLSSDWTRRATANKIPAKAGIHSSDTLTRREMGPGLRRDPISWFLSFGAAAAGARRYREADKLARAGAGPEEQDISVGGSLLQLVGRFLRRLHWLLVDRDDDIARLDPERGGRAVACDLGHDEIGR